MSDEVGRQRVRRGRPGRTTAPMPTAVRTSGEENPNRALTPATAAATRTQRDERGPRRDTPGSLASATGGPLPAAVTHAGASSGRRDQATRGSTTKSRCSLVALQQAQVARRDLGEDDAAAGTPGPPVRADEHAEPGRVPDLQRADVQQEVALALVDTGLQGVAHRGRRPGVEPARRARPLPRAGSTRTSNSRSMSAPLLSLRDHLRQIRRARGVSVAPSRPRVD